MSKWVMPGWLPIMRGIEFIGVLVTIGVVLFDFLVERPIDRAVRKATLFAQMAQTHALKDGAGLKALRPTILALVEEGIPIEGQILRGVDLSKADLRTAQFPESDLTGANLSRADLTGADLSDADLTGADLSDANLTGADLIDAKLRDAIFRGTVVNSETRGLDGLSDDQRDGLFHVDSDPDAGAQSDGPSRVAQITVGTAQHIIGTPRLLRRPQRL